MCNFYRLSGNQNSRTCSTTWSKFIIGLDDLTAIQKGYNPVNDVVVVVSVCPQNNSQAALGKYKSSGEKGAAAQESLFVADHAYWMWISLTHFLHIPLGHLTPKWNRLQSAQSHLLIIQHCCIITNSWISKKKKKKDGYNAFNFDLWSQCYCVLLDSVYCVTLSPLSALKSLREEEEAPPLFGI